MMTALKDAFTQFSSMHMKAMTGFTANLGYLENRIKVLESFHSVTSLPVENPISPPAAVLEPIWLWCDKCDTAFPASDFGGKPCPGCEGPLRETQE